MAASGSPPVYSCVSFREVRKDSFSISGFVFFVVDRDIYVKKH